jgi:tRNA(fMet)-specific endonuclease VapC
VYCLDTNIWSYLLRQPNAALIENLKSHTSSEICLTELIRAELLFGAKRSNRAKELTSKINELLAPFSYLPFDSETAVHYAEIRFLLEKKGIPISPNDVIIAATARAAGATLVTANIREFARVPDLHCEDWTVA